MPSKKKSSKTPSKASNSDQNGDLWQSPSVSSSISSALCPSDDQLLASIDEASVRFPSLISRAAIIGRAVEGAVSDSGGFKVWLSESAMVSASIPPGSLVSVSLSSLDKSPNSFHLTELSIECAERFGFHPSGNMADEAGNFFALATVLTSSKVVKNGVRLSANLSYTMGCPNTGRIMFIHPVQFYSVNGNLHGPVNDCISLDNCKFYLSPVSCKNKVETEGTVSSDQCKEVDHALMANDYFSTPTKSSHLDTEVSSPYSAQSKTTCGSRSLSKTTYSSEASTGLLDLEQALGDDVSRKLLDTCVRTWLGSQSLLSGNMVAIPLLQRLYFFQVVGSKGLSPSSNIWNDMGQYLATPKPDLGKAEVSVFSVCSGTKIHLARIRSGCSAVNSQRANAPKLGGLSKELAVLKRIILSSASQVAISRLGLRPTKGVLLHGPPGTGKTTLARVCTQDAGISIFNINGPEIIRQYHGETEQALQEVFNKAREASPSVVFIDELDAIAPARERGGDELSQRMVATLLNLMDGIARTDGVLVIAATNRPDSIEPALRRHGRLDREIEIGVPSPTQRHEILLIHLSEIKHSLSDKDIQDIAMDAHGFVGADLASLCSAADLVRHRKFIAAAKSRGADIDILQRLGDYVKSDLEDAVPDTSVTHSSVFKDGIGANGVCSLNGLLKVTFDDFKEARCRVMPSAMREVNLEVPKVSWEDVGGQLEVKAQLMEAVLWPQKHADAFERIGTRPPHGILLFGPPGCSKTLLARAVASEAGLNFLAVKGPELFSKWVGESEKAVRSIFAKARANAPSIIFFDEIDGLAGTRGKEGDEVSVGDRVISQFLVELDGLQGRGKVTVIGATNRPDKIDIALLRPGRFDRMLYVGPPNRKDRENIFRIHLRQMPYSSDVSISELSRLTEGCTGAHISGICRQAGLNALDRAVEENRSHLDIKITMEDIKVGIEQVQLQPSTVQMYEKLSTKFKRLVHSISEEDDDDDSEIGANHVGLWTRLLSSIFSFFGLLGFIRQPSSS